jgi:hypothetical protein
LVNATGGGGAEGRGGGKRAKYGLQSPYACIIRRRVHIGLHTLVLIKNIVKTLALILEEPKHYSVCHYRKTTI